MMRRRSFEAKRPGPVVPADHVARYMLRREPPCGSRVVSSFFAHLIWAERRSPLAQAVMDLSSADPSAARCSDNVCSSGRYRAMWRSPAAARLSADWPSGNAPTTRVRRLISRRMRSSGLLTGMRFSVPMLRPRYSRSRRMVRPSGQKHPGARKCGQADPHYEPRARVIRWPPLRLASSR
jgi:hypothetical protein